MNTIQNGKLSALNSVRAIHQFHPAVSPGDAITDYLLVLRKIFKSYGFESEIFCQYPSTGIPTIPFQEYKNISHSKNLLLLHFSIAYSEETMSFFEGVRDQKILVYHNITPSHFFTGFNALFEKECARGREQLSRFASICSSAIGDSEFNCRELRENGFAKALAVPILLDFEKYRSLPSSSILSKFNDGKINILSVGRIVPNKRYDEILRAFACYKRFLNKSSRLILVGKYEGGLEGYLLCLQNMANELRCEDVHFVGHVPHADLLAYYRIADIFLCMSEHEGFCVPLLESMFFRIPVIAYSAGAVPETLGNAGILVKEHDPLLIAETIEYVLKHEDIKDEILKKQDELLKEYSRERIEKKLIDAILDIQKVVEKRKGFSICIEGTFEDSYSLSVVNRNLGLALDREGVDVSFYATSGPGDYIPEFSKVTNPRVKELWLKQIPHPDVSIRNIYPLRIHDMKGSIRIFYFAWEETKIPDSWVTMFNQLDGVLVLSSFVRNVLVSCGVKTPIEIIPLGIDYELKKAKPDRLPFKTNKNFVFLNIGSAFPRKGLDVLLAAYTKEFSDRDDVCLVIKSFPNIHNRLKEMLASIPKESSPEIVHIEEDNMAPESMVSLYARANCFVSPTRGEGFGLPIAEAMFYRVPVIVTGFGGHLDFCDEESAILIPYQLVPSSSHLRVKGAMWAEPSESALREAMRRVYEERESPQIQQMVRRAHERVVDFCTWEGGAKRVLSFVRKIIENSIKLGMVTTWHQRCGIAEYSKYFLKALPPRIKPLILASRGQLLSKGIGNEFPVLRCWDSGNNKQDLNEIIEIALSRKLDLIHIQFNFGLFNFESLVSAIEELHRRGIRVFLTFHSVTSLLQLSEEFERIAKRFIVADLLLVHTEADRAYLSRLGLKQNVRVLPHGQILFENRSKENVRSCLGLKDTPIIATFGFFLPNKGILEMIRAIAKLRNIYPNILFLVVSSLYPLDDSEKYFRDCRDEVIKLNLEGRVIFFTDFLNPEEIAPLLQAADIVAMPYVASKESASGAVRFALASMRPVMVTDIPIFSEFKDEVIKIPSSNPKDISEGITKILSNPKDIVTTIEHVKYYLGKHSWEKISKMYSSLLEEIFYGSIEDKQFSF